MRALAAAAALLCACGGVERAGPGLPGGPPPPPKGAPSGKKAALIIDGSGGTVSLGALAVTIPPGALAAAVDVTIAELTGPPPLGLVGSVYQVAPADLALALPATFTFTVPVATDPADFALAHQDATGYWFRIYAVARDATTVSVASTAMGSWAMVAIAAQQDLTGAFQLFSTQEIPFAATGNATLQYLGSDAPFLLYAVTGTIELQLPVADCTPVTTFTPVSQAMPLSIAELEPGARFRWGINGRWDLACADGATWVGTNFDTLGVTNPRCARSWVTPPTLDAAHVQGQYQIACPAGGAVTASWDLLPAQ